MNKHRAIRAFIFIATVFASATLSVFNLPNDVRAQQSANIVSAERERGIKLYGQGDYKNAIEALRAAVEQHKDDADAWCYLGLALNRANIPQKAREAFEQALNLRPGFVTARVGLAYVLFVVDKWSEAEREAKLALKADPSSFESHYVIGAVQWQRDNFAQALEEAEAALKIKPTYMPALLLKTQSFTSLTNEGITLPRGAFSSIIVGEEENQILHDANRQFFSRAATSLQQYLRLIPNSSAATKLREQVETLQIYAHDRSVSDKQSTLFLSSEVDTKAIILSKPLPPFTEAAKTLGGANKAVIVRAVLDSSGAIKYALITKSPSYAFIEPIMSAVSKIHFKPAVKNGQAVSQIATIIYGYIGLKSLNSI